MKSWLRGSLGRLGPGLVTLGLSAFVVWGIGCGGGGGSGPAENPSSGSGSGGGDTADGSGGQTGPSGPDCSDGTCALCGDGMCPKGFYCDENGPEGPACQWLPECAEEATCGCVGEALGDACTCEERGAGVFVSC